VFFSDQIFGFIHFFLKWKLDKKLLIFLGNFDNHKIEKEKKKKKPGLQSPIIILWKLWAMLLSLGT
jgi:hypothetical protein